MEKPPEIKELVRYVELQLKLGMKPMICQPLLKLSHLPCLLRLRLRRRRPAYGDSPEMSPSENLLVNAFVVAQTADEMDSEDDKQKDVKQVGYITSTSNRELTSYTVSSCMCRY